VTRLGTEVHIRLRRDTDAGRPTSTYLAAPSQLHYWRRGNGVEAVEAACRRSLPAMRPLPDSPRLVQGSEAERARSRLLDTF
jgi:hypothetical protein